MLKETNEDKTKSEWQDTEREKIDLEKTNKSIREEEKTLLHKQRSKSIAFSPASQGVKKHTENWNTHW